MAIDVETVCTHQHLADEVGGTAQLNKLLTSTFQTDTSTVLRTNALRDVIRALERRHPPIRESDIQDPSQLREAVIYGSFMRLYIEAMTREGDIFSVKWKHYKSHFNQELTSLPIKLDTGVIGAPGSIPTSRR